MSDIPDNDLWADITPARDGWRWQINGDIPVCWRTYRDCRDTEWTAPGGTTSTRWGARRLARRYLKRIRAYMVKESEVIR